MWLAAAILKSRGRHCGLRCTSLPQSSPLCFQTPPPDGPQKPQALCASNQTQNPAYSTSSLLPILSITSSRASQKPGNCPPQLSSFPSHCVSGSVLTLTLSPKDLLFPALLVHRYRPNAVAFYTGHCSSPSGYRCSWDKEYNPCRGAWVA